MYQTQFKKQTNSGFYKIKNIYPSIDFQIKSFCLDSEQGIHPRIFCRRWFDLSVTNESNLPRFTEEQILAMESEHGYREKCINLLSKILQIQSNTIHRWGKGVSFEKIPIDKLRKYETYLGYIDAIRSIAVTMVEVLDEDSLSKLLQRLESKNLDIFTDLNVCKNYSDKQTNTGRQKFRDR